MLQRGARSPKVVQVIWVILELPEDPEVAGAAGAGPGSKIEARGGNLGPFCVGAVITPDRKILKLRRNDVFREYWRMGTPENVPARSKVAKSGQR